jgi:hypothetical protein
MEGSTMHARTRLIVRLLTALALASSMYVPRTFGASPRTARSVGACDAVVSKAKSRLARVLLACGRKRSTVAASRCGQSEWSRYSSRLARRGCSPQPTPTVLAKILPRPVLVKLESSGGAASDLAAADAEAAAAHLALRKLLRGLVGLVAKAGGSEAAGRATVAAHITEVRSTIDRLARAESTLEQREADVWSGFAIDPSLPWLIDEPLRDAMEELQIEVRRELGPEWRTEIADLRGEPGCGGDLVGDRMIAAYGNAVLDAGDDRSAEIAAIGRAAANLACLSAEQAALVDLSLAVAYDKVAARLEHAHLGRIVPDFARLVAPLEMLVLDTVKYRGEKALAWRWFVAERSTLRDEVDRLGWATGNVVWLYDRELGRIVGFSPCDGETFDRCVDLPALIASMADPRALGFGDCALSGMVARGLRHTGGDARYACPSTSCSTSSTTPSTGTSSPGGLPSINQLPGSLPTRPIAGTLPIGQIIPGGIQSSAGGNLPWSGLGASDVSAMHDLSCGGSSGAGGGSGGGSGGAQGPGGGGRLDGPQDCGRQALAASGDPYSTFARCAANVAGSGNGLQDPLDLQGVPMGAQCHPSVGGDAPDAGTTPPPAGSTPASTTPSSTTPTTTTPSSTATTTTLPAGSDQKKADNAVQATQDALTAVGLTSPEPGPSGAGAVIGVELELLKPSNAQSFMDYFTNIKLEKLYEECASEAIKASTCGVLTTMSKNDRVDYYNWLHQDCGDVEDCDGACTSLDEQVMKRMEGCEQALTQSLVGNPPNPHDPGTFTDPTPDAADDSHMPSDPLTSCLLASGTPAGGGQVDLTCGVVTCTDQNSTARSASACCGTATPLLGVTAGRIISERTCQTIHCTDGETAVADDTATCGCSSVGGPSGGGAPTPSPAPPSH